MTEKTVISCGIERLKVKHGLICCFPVKGRDEIKIFHDCGTNYKNISTNIENSTDIIIKNDGTYLICNEYGGYFNIYAIDENTQTMDDHKHQNVRFNNVYQYDWSCIKAFFELECGLYVLVDDVSDFWKKMTIIYVINPTNLNVVVKHTFFASINKAVPIRNNCFDVYLKNERLVEHFELQCDLCESLDDNLTR